MTLLMGRRCRTMWSRSFAWAIVAIFIGSTGVACVMPDKSSSNVIATRGVPSVSAAPTPQAAALGATVEVTTDLGTKAAYTVSNFRPASDSDRAHRVAAKRRQNHVARTTRHTDSNSYLAPTPADTGDDPRPSEPAGSAGAMSLALSRPARSRHERIAWPAKSAIRLAVLASPDAIA
jgi:hypothetical protein